MPWFGVLVPDTHPQSPGWDKTPLGMADPTQELAGAEGWGRHLGQGLLPALLQI